MKVFLTGGTGLVGSHTIECLVAAGHTVTALVRNGAGTDIVTSLGATPSNGCVEDESSWEAAHGCEAIVHGAALVTQRRSWAAFQAINIDGTRLAAVTAVRCGARLVHISSIAVYGRRPAAQPRSMDENAPWTRLAETDFYARSKRRAEEVIWSVAGETGLTAAALRPCVVYGERDRAFLPRVIGALRFGVAPLVGGGNNDLTVVYAGTVARAVLAAVERPDATGSFNVTNDGSMTQREFVLAVGRALGRRVRLFKIPVAAASAVATSYHHIHRLTRPRQYAGVALGVARFMAADNPFCSNRARDLLGWQPATSPTENVERSVRWHIDARDARRGA